MKWPISGILLAALCGTSCSNVGDKAPRFSFSTIDDQTIDLETFKDKIVVVNVWATWCPTCILEIPDLNRLFDKYAADTTVVFLGLCDEPKSKIDVILKRFPFKYPQVADATSYTKKLQTRLVKTYPQNLIIDENFDIVFEVSDGSADIFNAMDTKIQKLQNKAEN
ncbi:MAG: peroxiredoxin [Bacteroidia bacterium]|jgi:peroxiredoxin